MPLPQEIYLRQGYTLYGQFIEDKSPSRNYDILDQAVCSFNSAIRAAELLLPQNDVAIAKACISLTECHREYTYRHGQQIAKKKASITVAEGYVQRANKLAATAGINHLVARATTESAVLQARKAELVAKEQGRNADAPSDQKKKVRVLLEELQKQLMENGEHKLADLAAYWVRRLQKPTSPLTRNG
jgi:hypothetical protein